MTAQQLKNSILQMAVQGKLVPQDPNDEPASVLLDRIRAEKEQLIKQKKVKREKNPSYVFRGADNTPYEKIGDEVVPLDVPFDIPDSWEWVRLGQIVFNRGQCTPLDDFCYIDIGSINNKLQCLNSEETILSAAKAPSRARKLVDVGDILYSTVRPYLHNMCIIDRTFSRTPIASTGFAVMTCHSDLFNKYLFYYLMSPDFDSYANDTDNAKGVAYPAINDDRLYRALIPVPPVSEQYRIVEKIESLQGNLTEYGVKETELNLLNNVFPERLKKSILQMAVQGKLVPQDPDDEPASVLLERIRAEKQRLIAEGEIKKDKHESVIFRRDNSHYEKLDGIERCIDDEIPFEIPESWCWTRLGTMIGVQRGASPRPKGSPEYWSSERTPHHWIKISDITKYTQNDCLYDTDEFLTDLGATKSVFVDSDYLITAASGSLGKIAKLNISGYIYDGLMCMCFKNTSLEMDYIIILIQAMVEYLMSVSTGTAWKNITTDILKNLLVPLPPLSEQHCIVKKQQELLEIIKLI